VFEPSLSRSRGRYHLEEGEVGSLRLHMVSLLSSPDGNHGLCSCRASRGAPARVPRCFPFDLDPFPLVPFLPRPDANASSPGYLDDLKKAWKEGKFKTYARWGGVLNVVVAIVLCFLLLSYVPRAISVVHACSRRPGPELLANSTHARLYWCILGCPPGCPCSPSTWHSLTAPKHSLCF